MSEQQLTFLQHLREFGLVYQRKVRTEALTSRDHKLNTRCHWMLCLVVTTYMSNCPYTLTWGAVQLHPLRSFMES